MSGPGSKIFLRKQPSVEQLKQAIPTMVHHNIRGNDMDIGEAVYNIKTGNRVARSGWNGKGMHLVYASGGTFKTDDKDVGAMLPHVVMKTATGEFVPWLCSQTDLLATDWEKVE
jgi:hypothetical protein